MCVAVQLRLNSAGFTGAALARHAGGLPEFQVPEPDSEARGRFTECRNEFGRTVRRSIAESFRE